MKLMFDSKLSTFWVPPHAHQASKMKHFSKEKNIQFFSFEEHDENIA